MLFWTTKSRAPHVIWLPLIKNVISKNMKNTLITSILLMSFLVHSSENGYVKVPGAEGYYSHEQKNYNVFSSNNQSGLLLTNKNGESIVEVLDENNDGKVDLIRYSTLDEKGNIFTRVEDYDMNGKLDVKFTYSKNQSITKTEINYFGCWRVINNKNGNHYIQKGKNIVPLTYIKGKFTYNKSLKKDAQTPCAF